MQEVLGAARCDSAGRREALRRVVFNSFVVSEWERKQQQANVALIKADSTLRSSRAVPHPSTDRALRRLTSEVRRDPVHSTRYGRQR